MGRTRASPHAVASAELQCFWSLKYTIQALVVLRPRVLYCKLVCAHQPFQCFSLMPSSKLCSLHAVPLQKFLVLSLAGCFVQGLAAALALSWIRRRLVGLNVICCQQYGVLLWTCCLLPVPVGCACVLRKNECSYMQERHVCVQDSTVSLVFLQHLYLSCCVCSELHGSMGRYNVSSSQR